ncbi:hypothetical protein B0H17DRAFT_1145982 [Mycena rosella]|uniref:Uncharacterized protein n=1 Tax=Mycena rosella TaxID=1033263 RepID=A0AAD7CPV9_MYCRO|nr:hypothetical protein B0H17DRAFT_1145982 [Mycena rosella]
MSTELTADAALNPCAPDKLVRSVNGGITGVLEEELPHSTVTHCAVGLARVQGNWQTVVRAHCEGLGRRIDVGARFGGGTVHVWTGEAALPTAGAWEGLKRGPPARIHVIVSDINGQTLGQTATCPNKTISLTFHRDRLLTASPTHAPFCHRLLKPSILRDSVSAQLVPGILKFLGVTHSQWQCGTPHASSEPTGIHWAFIAHGLETHEIVERNAEWHTYICRGPVSRSSLFRTNFWARGLERLEHLESTRILELTRAPEL